MSCPKVYNKSREHRQRSLPSRVSQIVGVFLLAREPKVKEDLFIFFTEAY